MFEVRVFRKDGTLKERISPELLTAKHWEDFRLMDGQGIAMKKKREAEYQISLRKRQDEFYE
jgi:hypothetical protein